MAVTTNIYGYIYDTEGQKITSGRIIVSLSQDFITIDGSKVAPFLVQSDLGTGGLIDFNLCPTSNNVSGSAYGQPYPKGVLYTFEFDPAPNDNSLPLVNKDGYWRELFDVPHISDTVEDNQISMGALVPAVYGLPVNNPTFASLTDARLLTPEQKATLTGGPANNADALHSHGVGGSYTNLLKIDEAPSAQTDYAQIYLMASGVTPNKQIIVYGKLENGSTYIIATGVV